MKRFFLIAVSLCLSLISTSASADYQVLSNEQTTVSNPQSALGTVVRTELVVQEGSNPLNRFTVHRVVKSGVPIRGVVLLLPPARTLNFDAYELADNGMYSSSLVGQLVAANIEVWGYSFRTKGIVGGSCENGTVDCSVMSGWGMNTVLQDVQYVRGLMAWLRPDARPVIGGYSMGAMMVYALLNQDPGAYSGAIIWEGFQYSRDPAITGPAATQCQSLTTQVATGTPYDGTSFTGLKALCGAQLANPTGPERGIYLSVLTSARPDPVPGYTLAVGNAAENKLTYSSEQRVADLVMRLNDYDALALLRDVECGIAGARDFTNNLGKYTGPVLAVRAGHGFGSGMGDNLALLGSKDVQTVDLKDLGHFDTTTNAKHTAQLDVPIRDWLLNKVFKQ